MSYQVRRALPFIVQHTARFAHTAKHDEAAVRQLLHGDHSLKALRHITIDHPVFHVTEKNHRIVVLNRPKALNALSLDMVRYMTPRYLVRILTELCGDTAGMGCI